jgi:hypothetical protein
MKELLDYYKYYLIKMMFFERLKELENRIEE